MNTIQHISHQLAQYKAGNIGRTTIRHTLLNELARLNNILDGGGFNSMTNRELSCILDKYWSLQHLYSTLKTSWVAADWTLIDTSTETCS